MFNVSITNGARPTTRLSTAAVNQVVQPRFEAPVTTNPLTSVFHFCRATSCTASIARTALLTIGNSNGQVGSPVFKCLRNVSLIRSSSDLLPSSGWLGTW